MSHNLALIPQPKRFHIDVVKNILQLLDILLVFIRQEYDNPLKVIQLLFQVLVNVNDCLGWRFYLIRAKFLDKRPNWIR